MKRNLLYLVLDTNVLLLWLVGQVDREILSKFKRLNLFEPGDYLLLERLVSQFRHIITTPHVLAEVSNFAAQVPVPQRQGVMLALKRFAESQREHYELASSLVQRPEFPDIGLADTGLLSLGATDVVLTTDVKLYSRILSLRGHSINFNHLRAPKLAD